MEATITVSANIGVATLQKQVTAIVTEKHIIVSGIRFAKNPHFYGILWVNPKMWEKIQ